MTVFNIFKTAIADVIRRPYPALWLWAGNLLISLALIAPIYAVADADLSHSLGGQRLLESFDVTWLMDGAGKYIDLLPMAAPVVAVTALAFLLISAFLTGGSLAHLAAEDRGRTSAAIFLSDCGRLFLPLLRLVALALVCYGLVLGALSLLLDAVLSLWTGDPLTEWAGLIAGNIKTGLLLLVFSILSMIFDYAKVNMALSDDPRALGSLGAGFGFVRRNFLPAWSLYLLCAVLFGVASLVYLEITRVIPDSAVFLVVVAFILHQIFIAVRCGVRLVFFASQIGFIRTRKS
jgi:hypothetical protein